MGKSEAWNIYRRMIIMGYFLLMNLCNRKVVDTLYTVHPNPWWTKMVLDWDVEVQIKFAKELWNLAF